MAISETDAINGLSFPATAVKVSSAEPAEIEREVIELFDQFRTPLLRYVLSLGLSVHDGEEIIQEVFVALFRHLGRGKSRNNLRGWIFWVAHNLGLKQRHANQRSDNDTASNGMIVESQIDPSPNPEERILYAQRQGRLLAVLRAMPEQDQSCLRLRAEGLRYREIARALGISLGAVSGSLTRSLARLMLADEV